MTELFVHSQHDVLFNVSLLLLLTSFQCPPRKGSSLDRRRRSWNLLTPSILSVCPVPFHNHPWLVVWFYVSCLPVPPDHWGQNNSRIQPNLFLSDFCLSSSCREFWGRMSGPGLCIRNYSYSKDGLIYLRNNSVHYMGFLDRTTMWLNTRILLPGVILFCLFRWMFRQLVETFDKKFFVRVRKSMIW